jgi:hypothetical protein
MSKRDFGNIKCLLHFDYPYFNEPNDGLGDEVGLETWSKENSYVALSGNAIPSAGARAPKFGYRCLFTGTNSSTNGDRTGALIGTNNTGIWNLNSSGKYEIEFFVFHQIIDETDGCIKYLLRLCTLDSGAVLTLALNTMGYIEVTCANWGITSAVTTSTIITTGGWRHVLLRVSHNILKIYINGTETLTKELTPNITLSVDNVRIGESIGSYNANSGMHFIDEFLFRHSAGSNAPVVPTEPYSGILDISKVGGFGNGTDGDVTISTNTQVNSYADIKAVNDSKTFSVSSWSIGSASPAIGREVMIFLYSRKNSDELLGFYAFSKIANIEDNTITLEDNITNDNGAYDFSLNSELIQNYNVRAIIVPHYNSLTLDAGKNINHAGGFVVFRVKGDCNINGSILTHGAGPLRSDLIQMTHSKLIDRFLCSQGGGIFIACGGTFSAPSTARLGASWSGLGDGSNGAAGYGGNGGGVNPSSTLSVSGGAGGVGGGGGGAACSGTTSSSYAAGGSAGSMGGSATVGSGGGGCGGNGGMGSSYVGGSGGGGQGGSGGSCGTGKTPSGIASSHTHHANGVNGGDCGTWDTNGTSSTSYTYYHSGAGGGAPGGNGGYGKAFKSASADSRSMGGGIAGACIILVCEKLNVDAAAISTGGAAGETRAFESGYNKIGGTGGGGTGFCYIACSEKVNS